MKIKKAMVYRGHGKEMPIVRDHSYRLNKKWFQFVQYMRKREFYIRQKAHKDLGVDPNRYTMGSYIDGYRATLTRAGFLIEVGRGKYEKVKQIPKLLTMEEAKAMYKRKEDNGTQQIDSVASRETRTAVRGTWRGPAVDW